jgi:5-oxoprolinase (ATP-hydrolysing)
MQTNGAPIGPDCARVAVDTGGTFTDLIALWPGGRRTRVKVASTPDDPSRAILAGLAALGLTRVPVLHHGTTVATNALLERRGARVALVTTAGFEDLLALGRQARPELYALHPVLPEPLVARGDVLGYPGRLGPAGEVLASAPPAWLQSVEEVLRAVDAVAVCTLHGYAHPAEEAALAAALEAAHPELFVSVSHRLAPVMREFERASTAVVNAYVAPVMARYLGRLASALTTTRVAIMGSAGGLLPVEAARRQPVDTVLSGPAGGARGAWAVAERLGIRDLLAVDMGGTSTDVSVVSGELLPDDEGQLGEHPLRVPLLPIETVGAGGGSVAWVDAGGALRVGPHSAGASPGPACYGRGGDRPTVTDAHVVLGHLNSLLGGAMPLDRDAAHRAVATLCGPLGLTGVEVASAIVATVDANMARACRRVSTGRGIDPRGLTLMAFGGATGLHACRLADELGCAAVVFPREPGLLSAEGMLSAPWAAEVSRPMNLVEADWSSAVLGEAVAALGAEVCAELARATAAEATVTHRALVRFRGQTHGLSVPVDADDLRPASLRRAFEAAHHARFGHSFGPERPAELLALRCLGRASSGLTPDEPVDTTFDATLLVGPAVRSAYSSTLLVPTGWRAEPLPSGDVRCVRIGDAPPAPSQGLEIHRQRLAAIAEEMGNVLMRAAFSANIKERRDFSCALFDADGEMLEHAAHIPVHLGSTPMSVAAARAAIRFEPGMSVLLNDPFAGGTHLPDVTLVTPVFLPGGERPMFFVANRAHHADVGGISAGSLPAPRGADGVVRALTIDDEGLRLPPVVLDEEVEARFAAASRVPDDRHGDLQAQRAANDVGVQALLALVSRGGEAAVTAWNAALLDYAERRMRRVLADLPSGEASFTDWLDDDGHGEAPIPLPVSVRLRGDTAEFDFTAAPDQVAGPMNAVRAIAVSAVFYVLKCLAGDEIPANAGLLRPVTIRTRTGSIVDALPPAAVSAGNVETSQRLVDALFGALALLAPGRIPAASGGSMNNVLFGGRLPGVDAGNFVHYETLGGGAGASAEAPGASGRHTHMTNTLNTPVEALERLFPVRIETYALRPAPDARPGEHAGGAGIVRAYRFLVEAEVTVLAERRRLAPWGVGGAAAGALGRHRLRRTDGSEVKLPGKVTLRVAAGETLIVETPGGGAHPAQNSRQSAGMSASPKEY